MKWVTAAAFLLVALASVQGAPAESSSEAAPAHYAISGRIDPANGNFDADVTITLPPSETRDAVSFLLGGQYELQQVTANPKASIVTSTVDEPVKGLKKIDVTFAPLPAKPVELRFRYRGPLNPGGDNADVLFSLELIELSIDSMWLPVRSGFNMSFTGDVDLRGIPSSMVVVSQGTSEHRDDRVRIHRPFLDLDLPLVATPGLKRKAGDEVEFFARDMDDAVVQAYWKHALQSSAFHEKAFGPLPGGPIRLIVVPREREVGYARRGYIVVSEARKPGAPAPDFKDKNIAHYIGHEFAHAWWFTGNPLSEDYWLAESMAEYASLRYLEANFGIAERDAALERKRESAKTAGPILSGKRPSKAGLYHKGPLLLFDLEKHITRPVMDKLLRQLAPNPPNTTAEFLSALRDAAGDESARYFESTLRSEGLPTP